MSDPSPPHDRGTRVAGRDAERARIDAFAAELQTGPSALIVSGEPGIGKTTLWWYGVDSCRRQGYRVLMTRPAHEEMTIAGVGLTDLFEGADVDATTILKEDDPFARGRSVQEALRRVLEAGPVLIAVDDAQWLDAATARALRYVLRRLESEPVGVLTTQRADAALDDQLELASALPPGRVDELRVGPLDIRELRDILSGTVSAISQPTLRRIQRASGGNPLYAIELARLLATASDPTRPDLPLPHSFNDAIDGRLDAVGPDLTPVLEVVSAVGRVSVDELEAILGSPELDGLLTEASNKGLLVTEANLEVRFAHPLIASAVYARLTPFARRDLHARLADHATDPDVRVRHRAAATAGSDPGLAAELEAAAERARAQSALDASVELIGQSLRLTSEDDPGARVRRTMALIEDLGSVGEVNRALELSDELVASLSSDASRARALLQRAELSDDDADTGLGYLAQALDDAQDDPGLRAQIQAQIGEFRLSMGGEVRESIRLATEALRAADELGDASMQLNVSTNLAWFHRLTGRPEPDLEQRALALEEQLGALPLTTGPSAMSVKYHLWDGDLPAAREALELSYRMVIANGFHMKLPQHYYDRSFVELASGDFGTAEEVIRRGIEATLDAGNTWAEAAFFHPLALLRTWLGRGDEALASASEMLDRAQQLRQPMVEMRARSVIGLGALSDGAFEDAARELGTVGRWLQARGIMHPGPVPAVPDAIEALSMVGDLEAADALLQDLVEGVEPIEGGWVEAIVDRSTGMLLTARGDAVSAIEALTRAVAAFDRLGFGPDAARAQLALGRAQIRAGKRTAPAESFSGARDRFLAMGAPRWAARAGEELERTSPGRSTGVLTPTERRVAELVAQGQKNREVAATMYMSVATVETHLTRVYRKMGVRSRSELTRLVAEGRLGPPDAEAPPDGEPGDP